jgi:adenylate kinase
VNRQTELGRSIEAIIKRGDYVDPDVMFQLIKNNVLTARANDQPFIIDGYGRTPADAALLRGLFQEIEVEPLVLFLEAGDAICKERILSRLVCNTCHRVYSKTMGYELSAPCPFCPDTLLEMRMNDTAAVIDKRLKQYREEIYPCYSMFLKDYPNIIYDTEHDLAISHADYEALIR